VEQFFKLTGRLVYEPVRKNFKKSGKVKTLIIELPYDGLVNVYRWFITRRYGCQTSPPMYGPHVTVVRGDEKPPMPNAWRKHEGKRIDVLVSPHVYRIFNWWALPVKCPQIFDLRAELGLHSAAYEPHLTIGRDDMEWTKPPFSKQQLEFLLKRPIYSQELTQQLENV
jgi:2'-5' RNA ligase